MEILPIFQQFLQNPAQKKYLLAVSGGVDSMVLFYLMLKTNFYFEVCHINFQLRGLESDIDQQFVEKICCKHQIICHSFKTDTISFAQKHDLSKQEAARIIRYEIFQTICNQRNLDFILTAHHLNDQTENLLYTLIKSSYHQIFEPIPTLHKNIFRPLINFTKQQILDYAQENQIVYREDSSNSKNDYARNKIRNQVIPILKEINPNLEKFLEKKWKNQNLKESFLQHHFQKIYKTQFEMVHSKIQIFSDHHNFFQDKPNELQLFFQFLIDYEFHFKWISDEQLKDLYYFSQKGKKLMDQEWYVFKEKRGLCFIHQDIINYSEELIIYEPGIYQWNVFKVKVDDTFKYPLKIRKWKAGDRLDNKKLSDYFTKRQYPAWLKQVAFVVETMDKKVVQVQENNFKGWND